MAIVLAFITICGMMNWCNSAILIESLGEARIINLHGRVVDEAGKPLAGISVNFKVYKPNPLLIVGYERTGIGLTESLITDAGGRFAIRNRWGHSLTIYRIENSNYKEDTSKRRFPRRFADLVLNHIGTSSDNPTVFEMRRKKR